MATNNVYRLAGRVGGFARAARYDGREMTAAARETFTASFLEGHACRVCPETRLPADLLPGERARRAEALRREHYARVALASARSRRSRAGHKRTAPAVEEPGAVMSEVRRGGDERPAA